MLSRINEVFSRRGVNVAAQYLQTDPRIGYVVIDIDPGAQGGAGHDTMALRREVEAIEGTIRTRLLY
jgi:D-3-phosphoglycerate dehydrogenase